MSTQTPPEQQASVSTQTTPHIRWSYLVGGIVGFAIAVAAAIFSNNTSSHGPSILGIGLAAVIIVLGILGGLFSLVRFLLDIIATRGHRGQSQSLRRPQI